MKYCQKCGKEMLDEAVICPGCGYPTDYYKEMQKLSQQGTTDAYELALSRKLGLTAIIGGIFIPLLGIICGIIGMIKANKYKFIHSDNSSVQQFFNLNLVGLILSVVLSIIYSLIISISFVL